MDLSVKSSKLCRIAGRSMRGVSLIEVLIAVLIMGIGLLGVAAMQMVALRNAQSSFDRTQAVVQSYAVLDAMRANVEAARADAYNLARTCDVPVAGSLIATDQHTWIKSLKADLGPSACGSISCASHVCTITVEWNDARATEGLAAQTVVIRSRI
jgi:type IV pilus assembly protein PilV